MTLKPIDVEELEMMQKARRNSRQGRRVSLVEAIPDFPMLKKRKAVQKVLLEESGAYISY